MREHVVLRWTCGTCGLAGVAGDRTRSGPGIARRKASRPTYSSADATRNARSLGRSQPRLDRIGSNWIASHAWIESDRLLHLVNQTPAAPNVVQTAAL